MEYLDGSMLQHLLSRGFDPTKYQSWYDEHIMTVPLFDFNYKLAGVQKYNPLGMKNVPDRSKQKYININPSGKQLVWGLEVELNSNLIFLTESIFKASALHSIGLNAWSVLGSSIAPPLRQQLDLLPYTFICVGDNDKSGMEFADTFKVGIVSNDLDELSTEELLNIFKQYRD